MNFGFSYVGLIYLAMLFIPNLFWTKYKPENYEKYVKNENKILKIFESISQVQHFPLLLFSYLEFTAKTFCLS